MEAPHIARYLQDCLALPHLPSNAPLFTCGSQTLTPFEAWEQLENLAYILSNDLKVQVGDRICILGQTTPITLQSILAVSAIGAIATPLNTRWTAKELAQAADTVAASVLITDAANAALAVQAAVLSPIICVVLVVDAIAQDVKEELRKKLTAASSTFDIRNEQRHSSFPQGVLSLNDLANRRKQQTHQTLRLRHAPNDAACIIFTSGTTGPPKAAVLSHAALHFQCQQKLIICGYNAQDVYLHTAAFYHVGGLCSALAMVLAGARHIFIPFFAAQVALQQIRQHSVTSFIAVPTMLSDFLTAAAAAPQELPATNSFFEADLPSVKTILVGAGGIHPTLLPQLGTMFPNATIHKAYGMTEACSSLTFATVRCARHSATAAGCEDTTSVPMLLPSDIQGGVYVGKPPPGIQLAVLIEGNNQQKTTETPSFSGKGEVVTKGPHVMSGYWSNSEASHNAFLPASSSENTTNLWLRTGDLGYLHQGHLWLFGRAKDVVKSGGENVNAAEVERILVHHPAVEAACVVGIPDVRLGELVAVALVLKRNSSSSSTEKYFTWQGSACQILLPSTRNNYTANSSESITVNKRQHHNHKTDAAIDGFFLQQFCRNQGLAAFKLPRVFFITDELPTNSTGKIVKASVKQLIQDAIDTNKSQNNQKGRVNIRSKL